MKSSRSVHYGAFAATAIALLAGGYLAASGSANSSLQTHAQPASPARPARLDDTRDLQSMKARADLVFQGEVVDLQYVQSTPREDQVALPHTFVTYRVDSVLKGNAGGETVTLRFLGGLDPSGKYLRASISPQFDLGDTDILFVQRNGTAICPLVENSAGRLRVIEGRVYTDLGREIHVGPNGSLGTGPRHLLEAVRVTHVAGGEDEVMGFGPDALVDTPSNAAAVHEVLDAIATTLHEATGRVDVDEALFVSANATVPFLAPDFAAAPPPASTGAPVILTDEERAELASIPQPNRSVTRAVGPVLEQTRDRREQTEDNDG